MAHHILYVLYVLYVCTYVQIVHATLLLHAAVIHIQCTCIHVQGVQHWPPCLLCTYVTLLLSTSYTNGDICVYMVPYPAD